MLTSIEQDTIVAVATAVGRGGIGIIRLSGINALSIAESICGKKLLPRLATYCSFSDNKKTVLDQGIAIFFKGPHSFTGEDVVELQMHGSQIVLDLLIMSCINLGARQAKPGEFSERAFLNDKLDLIQAEAIADLVVSSNEASAKSAIKSLQGTFSKEVNLLIDELIYLRAYVEAAMDFPEEEVDFLSDGKIKEKINGLLEQIKIISNTTKQGVLLNEGMTIVIVGLPNAGKSSLLNALSERDSAIVTDIPGTTRDILREDIQIDGLPLHIIDTAGLRKSSDLIEQEGIKRAQKAIQTADRLILVLDKNDTKTTEITLEDIWPKELGNSPKHIPITIIKNKCDLTNDLPSIFGNTITLSAKNGQGLDLLRKHLKEVMGFQTTNTGIFSARRRHLEALNEADKKINIGLELIKKQNNPELLAEELRLAQKNLEEITGRFTTDDLLDKIFRDFCIGK